MRMQQSGRCGICDLRLPDGAACPNYWCRRADRAFDVVWAVGEHTGGLRRAVAAAKYRADDRRAVLLGQLLGRYLLDRAPCFDDIELIVATPGSRRSSGHVPRLLEVAASLVGDLWEIDVVSAAGPVLAKRGDSRPLATSPTGAVRRLRAAGELRPTLTVERPERVLGRRVLAVDDVFTDGSTLREVARALRLAGAVGVSGLVLARQPLAARRARPADRAAGAMLGAGHLGW